MEMYGYTAPEFFRVDDLLDFSNDQISSSSSSVATEYSDHHHNLPTYYADQNITITSSSSAAATSNVDFHSSSFSTVEDEFTPNLCLPNEDVAQLEWLSNFVDDSYSNFPVNEFTGTINFRSGPPFHGRSGAKKSRAFSTNHSRTSTPASHTQINDKINKHQRENQNSPNSSTATSHTEARRCTHCASEKTPQWRTGPLGPKTLCNACGVRFKSGRLVPEYRPAASPTFVLTQHSNSHRKVMELRRQKEEQGEIRQHNRNFEVC